MTRRRLELAADWLLIACAVGLVASEFLTWSHQYPRAALTVPGFAVALRGVPRDATAWQVYSGADVLIAMLAPALFACALLERPRVRLVMLVLVGGALAFALHALAVPPTNGVDIAIPLAGHSRSLRVLAGAGAGETVAIGVLGVALAALAAALVAGRRAPERQRRQPILEGADVDHLRREAPRAP